jgi:hypothetical protein
VRSCSDCYEALASIKTVHFLIRCVITVAVGRMHYVVDCLDE